MATTLAELARQPAAARLDVGGLGPPDVATFLAAATGSEPSEDLVTAVCDHTQGNPFFLSEMAQLLCSEDEGALSLPAAVPAGVRDVIRRRLSLLPPQTYNVLSLAAVVGQDFDLHVVARMEGLDDEQALEAIEPALAARVVLDSGEVGCYRFSHGLVRQTLYEELNSARRARLHRRVAEVLETVRSLEEGPGLVEVANHFWLAASTGVADKAIAYAGRAAQQALTRLAYEQAEEQLGRAFELVARLPAGVQRARQELDLQVRKCMLLTFTRGRASPAVGEACARGRELCREVDDPDQLVAALYRLGSYNSMRGVLPTQEELDEQMEAAERSGDPAVAVVAHRGSGAVHFYRGNLERAHDHLQRAFDGGNPLNDPRLITSFNVDPGVNYRFPLAMVVGALGDEAGARELSDAGIARARQLTDPYTLAFAICGASYVSTLLDDPTLAVELSQEGLEICRQRGFSLFGAWLSVFGGWALVATGEASEGFALLDRGLADCESAGARLLRPFYLGLFADALRREGRLQESISTLDEALEIAERSGERFYEAELHRLRGEVMAARWPDRRAEAEASIRRALAVAQAQKAALFARRAEVSLAKFTEVEPLGPAASEASSL
jgi:tetratricopeptide (TPR) repeat protein